MKERKTTIRPVEEIRKLAVDMMVAVRCTTKGAEAAAEVFIEAELRGISLQGLDYMPITIKALQSGRVKPDAELKVAKEGPGYLFIDGQGGLGQYLGQSAVDLAVAKASSAGACIACLYDSSELYMLGHYVERAARAGKIALACSTCYPLCHPWGGLERIFGTNPIAASFPTAEENPVVIDMATAAYANGRVRQAAYHDEHVPAGSGINAQGYPTTVAKEIQEGAISPLGGAKGYALQLMVALLCGPLTGADVGKALEGTKYGGNSGAKIGHFFLVIDPEHIVGLDSFRASTSAFLDEIRNSQAAPGFDEVRIPGDRQFRQREIYKKEGVPILQATWDILTELAEEIGVEMPS